MLVYYTIFVIACTGQPNHSVSYTFSSERNRDIITQNVLKDPALNKGCTVIQAIKGKRTK